MHVPEGQSRQEQSTAEEEEEEWDDEQRRSAANRVCGEDRNEGFPAAFIFDPALLPQSGCMAGSQRKEETGQQPPRGEGLP